MVERQHVGVRQSQGKDSPHLGGRGHELEGAALLAVDPTVVVDPVEAVVDAMVDSVSASGRVELEVEGGDAEVVEEDGVIRAASKSANGVISVDGGVDICIKDISGGAVLEEYVAV